MGKWINSQFALEKHGQKCRGTIGRNSVKKKPLHSWWRDHNQDADHWANLGAEGQKKIFVDKGCDKERWKAVKGFWDGSSKNNGRTVAESLSKALSRTNGSQSAKSRHL